MASILPYANSDKVSSSETFKSSLPDVKNDLILQELAYGKILAIPIFSDVAATALFDCARPFIDPYQMVKLDGEWRIANKFCVDY